MLCEKYTILNLEQGSKEWHEARRNRIGASDAAAIMGVSPWTTPYQLWRRKLGLIPEQEENGAMRRGKELEVKAREICCELLDCELFPLTIVPEDDPWMICSYDGINLDKRIAVEIKCPGKVDHGKAESGEIPEKYRPQLKHQLYVCGFDEIYYFSYGKSTIRMLKYERNEWDVKQQILIEKRFWDGLQNLEPPEMTEKDLIDWG